MSLCWKYLTPIAMFNLIGCAFWMWAFDGQSLFNLIFKASSVATGAGH